MGNFAEALSLYSCNRLVCARCQRSANPMNARLRRLLIVTLLALLVSTAPVSVLHAQSDSAAATADDTVPAVVLPDLQPQDQAPATDTAPLGSAREQSEASAPCLAGQIKANRNSGIYHVPGGASYAVTKVNVVCYDVEDGAQAAGFRRALR
jgi:hypothetical protein